MIQTITVSIRGARNVQGQGSGVRIVRYHCTRGPLFRIATNTVRVNAIVRVEDIITPLIHVVRLAVTVQAWHGRKAITSHRPCGDLSSSQ